jgi:GIY-YIG catalytic domain
MNSMPKVVIDYSNTIIYKITCKDPNIKDVYVGHTTNFVQRKHAHKNSCSNENSSNYNCKLYQAIRNNGGWNNWNMEIVNFFNCNDHYEARKKEQEYFELLNATLNSIEPMPKPKFKRQPKANPNQPVKNDKTPAIEVRQEESKLPILTTEIFMELLKRNTELIELVKLYRNPPTENH